jgi:putative ubiquitin-RnfH superfamily antitoxin RatB of RatAB toxin-antitoxin module
MVMQHKRCQIVFALPERQWSWTVTVSAEATVAQVLEAARRETMNAAIPWDSTDVGIFGEPCSLDAIPGNGDRIEIYRPLKADPKESRRERARAPKRGPDPDASRRPASRRP